MKTNFSLCENGGSIRELRHQSGARFQRAVGRQDACPTQQLGSPIERVPRASPLNRPFKSYLVRALWLLFLISGMTFMVKRTSAVFTYMGSSNHKDDNSEPCVQDEDTCPTCLTGGPRAGAPGGAPGGNNCGS